MAFARRTKFCLGLDALLLALNVWLKNLRNYLLFHTREGTRVYRGPGNIYPVYFLHSALMH